MPLNPKRIDGNRNEEHVLDNHIIESKYSGADAYGYDMYKNTRSKLGELLYFFKHKNKHDKLK